MKITGFIWLCYVSIIANSYAQNIKPTLQDSLDVYNNSIAVREFYEKKGLYTKTGETRIRTDDLMKIHGGNDKKYAEVLKTINNERYTPQGKRKIRIEEYRVNIDEYRYKQRELSDYVLNMDAPMQLFDRRIAPQLPMDYTMSRSPGNPLNDDDVDFRMYDPIAVKPYSLLTKAEKTERDAKYPYKEKPVPVAETVKNKPKPEPKKVTERPAAAPVKSETKKVAQPKVESEFVIGGPVPDSVRGRRFKTRREAEEFIKRLPVSGGEE